MKLNWILLPIAVFAAPKGGSDKDSIQKCNNQIEQAKDIEIRASKLKTEAKDFEIQVYKLKTEASKLSHEMIELDRTVCFRYKEVNADERQKYFNILSGIVNFLTLSLRK